MDSAERFGVVVMVPLTATFLYVLTVFSFGLAGDVAGRPSMYPARMFTLPVSTTALTLWPMLYGGAAMVLLWLATRFLAVWPSGFDIPVIWPALAAMSLLAWTQALTWMPYGLPGLRVIVAVLWLGVMDSIVLLAIQYKAPEPVMLAILAPQIPVAYVAARFAVTRARRGDMPDWRGAFARLGAMLAIRPQRRDRFPSAARAQLWLEWRRHGRLLPALVGVLLPFELALLFVAGRDTPALVCYTVLGVLLTPPVMAGFAAASVSEATPFGMTRPLTSAALIAAKLRMAIWSTLAAWLLVLVAIPLALTLSGTWPVVIERASRLLDAVGTPRAIAIAFLGFSGLLVSTWNRLVQSYYIGLTGRAWVVKGNVFLTLTFLFILGLMVQWIIDHRAVQSAVWNALPPTLAMLACVKVSAAAWVATRLYRSRLLSDRTLVTGAATWCGAVLALHGLLVWLLDTPFFPSSLLALGAILAVPLVRLSAAPLALTWNRHR